MKTPVEVDIINEICCILIKLLFIVYILFKNLFRLTILFSLDGQKVREFRTLFRLCRRA